MEVKATGKLIKSSVYKINLVINLIRRTTVEDAINQLRFCSRPISCKLLQVLNSAVANAENNHQIDADRLFVEKVLLGKYKTLKRMRYRARGRVNRIEKPFSRVTIYLKEVK